MLLNVATLWNSSEFVRQPSSDGIVFAHRKIGLQCRIDRFYFGGRENTPSPYAIGKNSLFTIDIVLVFNRADDLLQHILKRD